MTKKQQEENSVPSESIKESLKATIERELIQSTPSINMAPPRFSQVSHAQEVAITQEMMLAAAQDIDERIKEYAEHLVRLRHEWQPIASSAERDAGSRDSIH